MVLLMSPKGEDSLTAKWVGPYKVLKRLGETTYLVDAPKGSGGGRGRKCHRNLMKRYFLQVLSTFTMLATGRASSSHLARGREKGDHAATMCTVSSFHQAA